MRRIILGLFTVVTAGAVIATGMTGAFFSDTETSTANVFAAGAIDLKVDNESYYNGIATTSLSWNLADLDEGHLFFNFLDLKPHDEGEDTISLHVGTNDAWACMNLTLTSNDDRSSNEPELESPDAPENPADIWDGELAQNIQMFWWADDGDNVYEVGEGGPGNLGLSSGVQTLFDLATSTPFFVALADADENVWGNLGPIPGDEIRYIGKAWCFGTLTLTPVAANGGVDPTVNPGVACDGTGLGNITQTDGATLDIQFSAIQARHNQKFQCTPTEEEPGTSLTLKKEVEGVEGGLDEEPSAWTLSASGNTPFSGPGPSVNSSVTPGIYNLSETGPAGYIASSWVCTGGNQTDSDTIEIAGGQNVTCTITNTEEQILTCNADLDMILVLDRSGSISNSEEQTLKNAAHSFVSALAPSTAGVHIGQSSFSTTGSLDLHLTGDEAATHLAINDITTTGSTDLEAGITLATGELDNTHEHERPTSPDIVVIITDGNPNIPNETQAETDASAAADAARAAGIEIYVVGVGGDVDATYLMNEIADGPDHYFAAADFDDLQTILRGLVACEQNRVAYNYVGVTITNDGTGGLPIAFEHDSDVFPWTAATDINNSTSTPTNGQYNDIESDDDQRWTSLNPGSGDFVVKRFRFFISTTTQPSATIDDIKVLWKGQPNADANASMWTHKTGTSDFTATNWVQLGASLGMLNDSDGYIVRHIADADVETYLNTLTGQIDIVLTIDNDNEILRTDYIELLVTSSL